MASVTVSTADTSSGVLTRLETLIQETKDQLDNEADTRHRIIDLILHDVLAWPRNCVSVEECIRPGFADYVLRRSTDDALLLIEAKRSGLFFELPAAYQAEETPVISKLASFLQMRTSRRRCSKYDRIVLTWGASLQASQTATNGYFLGFSRKGSAGNRYKLS